MRDNVLYCILIIVSHWSMTKINITYRGNSLCIIKLKNKLFLPTRFKRSDCLFQDTKQMPSIIAIGWGAPNHFISLVVEKNEKDIPIKSYSLNDSIKIYDKLSQLLQNINFHLE